MIRLALLLLLVASAGIYVARLLGRRRADRIAQLRAAFLIARSEARANGPALKSVTLRDGITQFRVPASWTEEYDDQTHAAFYDRRNPARRLSVTSKPATTPNLAVRDQAGPLANVETLRGGGVLAKGLASRRDEHRLAYQWWVACSLSAELGRLVLFELTVPEDAAADPITQDDVGTVEGEIRAIRFLPAAEP